MSVNAQVDSGNASHVGCAERFVRHALSHVTNAPDEHVLPYDTNGSGLAVGDLDGDDRPDLVIGDLRSSTSLMWNEGSFRFTSAVLEDVNGGLPETETRAIVIADLDADGKPDILTTHTGGSVALWRNLGGRRFESSSIAAISTPAYSLLVDDLDLDGDLDIVTASYDALLEKEQGNSFLLSAGGGVMVYLRNGSDYSDGYTATRLERKSQTLAMTLFDVSGDGVRDLVVGNDFGVPDYAWNIDVTRSPAQWEPIRPFQRISRNTMGFAIGDPNGDQRFDLFATDMKPNLGDIDEVAAWSPLIDRPFQKLQRSDIQRAENVLQIRTGSGGFVNKAYVRGMDATGWSWSAQFGDLDADGNEDLYIVNGMIDHDLLPYLPQDELVEPNVMFRGRGGSRFDKNTTWGLNSKSSGRSMALADLNADGRLDVVINNLRAASEVYENRHCGGNTVGVNLQWTGQQNESALGSTVVLVSDDSRQARLVTGTGGYLTGLDGSVHFGTGDATAARVEVTWPDGATSSVDIAQRGRSDHRSLLITRNSASDPAQSQPTDTTHNEEPR